MATAIRIFYLIDLVLDLFTASNLKKIVETVTEYYTDVLNITLNEFISPNIMKIAENSDRNELGRFLQLILGNFAT